MADLPQNPLVYQPQPTGTGPAGATFADAFLQLLQQQKQQELQRQANEQTLAQGGANLAATEQKTQLTAADAAKKLKDDQEFDASIDAGVKDGSITPAKAAILKAAKKASGGISVPWELIQPKTGAPPNTEAVGPDGSIAIWDGTKYVDQAGKPLPPGSVKRATPAGSPDAAADMEYQRIQQKIALGQSATPEEAATVKAYEKRKTLGPTTTYNLGSAARAEAVDAKEQARMDRSYQANVNELDQTRKPILDRASRLANLQSTLDQGSPQADALIAPELLTVMAGGQGSGLRMNEAEIARIVGGRSAWQNLQAAVQHWSANPSEARSITPEQDQQIRALMQTVTDRTQQQLKVLRDARLNLAGAGSVDEHRKIMNDFQDQFDALATGGKGAAADGSLPPASAFAGQKPGDYHAKDPSGRSVLVHWDGKAVTKAGG
jgi:hypothetical protein